MLRKLFIVMLSVFMMASLCHGKEIAGVDIPESIETEQGDLILNGAGVRSKLFIKLYVGGLYLEQKNDDPENIISADKPMAVRLHIISSMITSEKMEDATREGFSNSTSGKTEPIQDQIEKFITVFKEEIEEDDIYDLIYLPDKGTDVYKNSEYHSSMEGLPFKQAMFGIWLCDKPAQASLKKEMLGK